MSLTLAGKTAIITGAGSGIGKSVASLFAQLEAKLVLMDRDIERLEIVTTEIEKKGSVCKAYPVDVTDYVGLKELFERDSEELGAIDILVSNAGIWQYDLLLEMEHAQLRKVMNTNFEGHFNMTKIVAPQMVERCYGKIVYVSSVAGKVGSGVGASHYAASKGAIIAFARSLARELGIHNINVNAVCPGLIETPLATAPLNLGASEAYIKSCILKRLGKPEEVAAVIAFLSSNLSSFVTGQAWNVCGGLIFD